MKSARPRFKIKTGLLGSSDLSHLVARDTQLAKAHQEFQQSELAISLAAVSLPEPAPSRLVKVKVWSGSIIITYAEAKQHNLLWEYV